jgi:hypothetical protein
LLKSIVIIGTIVITLLISSVSNIFARGPRGDGPEDSTLEADACWANGYDSGFAEKFDKDRNDECQGEGEEGENYYNFGWAVGCEDGHHNTTRTITGRSVWECIKIMNNPVEIEDYEALEQEIILDCRLDGEQDYKDGKPFHKHLVHVVNLVIHIEMHTNLNVNRIIQKVTVRY